MKIISRATWAQTISCSEITNLTDSADNVDICVYRITWPISPGCVEGQDKLSHQTNDRSWKQNSRQALRALLCVRMRVNAPFTHMWYSFWVSWVPCARGCCSTSLRGHSVTFLGCHLSSIWGAQCRCGPHLKITESTLNKQKIWAPLSWLDGCPPCGCYQISSSSSSFPTCGKLVSSQVISHPPALNLSEQFCWLGHCRRFCLHESVCALSRTCIWKQLNQPPWGCLGVYMHACETKKSVWFYGHAGMAVFVWK